MITRWIRLAALLSLAGPTSLASTASAAPADFSITDFTVVYARDGVPTTGAAYSDNEGLTADVEFAVRSANGEIPRRAPERAHHIRFACRPQRLDLHSPDRGAAAFR